MVRRLRSILPAAATTLMVTGALPSAVAFDLPGPYDWRAPRGYTTWTPVKLVHRDGAIAYAFSRIGGRGFITLKFDCDNKSISFLDNDRWESEEDAPPQWFRSKDLQWATFPNSGQDLALAHICAIEIPRGRSIPSTGSP